MSPRTRAWVGAVLGAGGLLLVVVAALMKTPSLLWVGFLLMPPGAILVIWAIAGAVREIGDVQTRFDAQLRGELGRKEKDPPV